MFLPCTLGTGTSARWNGSARTSLTASLCAVSLLFPFENMPEHTKKAHLAPTKTLTLLGKLGIGRGGRIPTFYLLVPNQAPYQPEPRPELSSLVCCTPCTQARTIEFVSDTQKLRALPAVHEAPE